MEPADIIKACLERGILVSADDIRRIEGGLELEEFISSRTKAPHGDGAASGASGGKVTIRAKRQKRPDTLTPGHVIESHRKRFEALKGMLLSKTSAISIANARSSIVQQSLIGVVKNTHSSGFVLEDATGEVDVDCGDCGDAAAGDVVCIRGTLREGRMVCKEILFPDIPLIRPAGRMAATLLLVPSAPADGWQCLPVSDAVLLAEPIAGMQEANARILETSPMQLSLHKGGGRVDVLFFRGPGMDRNGALAALKKRGLKTGDPIGFFVIETAPDIFWIVGQPGSKEGDWSENYKGVTIVHSSDKQALVDLGTREVGFVQARQG